MKLNCKQSFFLFLTGFIFPFSVSAQALINEIAWMGTETDWRDEWIELRNKGINDVSLNGWILTIEGKKDIPLEGIIAANGYFVVRRPDETNPSDIPTDLFFSFGSGLRNLPEGEVLILKNKEGLEIDKIDASAGWPAGDNAAKQTMQRTDSGAWITAAATPKAKNTASQDDNYQTQNNQSQQQNAAQAGNADEPQITAEAGSDKTGLAGELIIFKGAAFGLQGKPLENALFNWNFGDGATKSGNPAPHIYRYPGDYRVSLSVSSGFYSASDSLNIKIFSPSLEISEIKPEPEGYVEIHNYSENELDASNLSLENENKYFYFPDGTKIGANAFLVIAQDAIKMPISEKGEINLRLANNSLLQKFAYGGDLEPNQSFHYINGEVKIGFQSPGEGKFAPIIAAQIAPKINLPADDSGDASKNNLSSSDNRLSKIVSSSTLEQNVASPAKILFQEENNSPASSLYFWLGIAGFLGILSGAIFFLFLKI